MLASDTLISMLALVAHSAAEPEDGLKGQIAEALVIRNRVIAGWGPWHQILQDHAKYTADQMPIQYKFGDPSRNDIFRKLLAHCEAVYANRERDTTADAETQQGALWCGRLDTASPWFTENIVRSSNHKRVAQIGLRAYFI